MIASQPLTLFDTAVRLKPFQIKQLGTYQISSSLGRSEMGEEYLGTHPQNGGTVLLRILPYSFPPRSCRIVNFEREIRAVAALNHPNLGSVVDFQIQGEAGALALEHVDGPTLAVRIAGGPIPVAEVVRWGLQLTSALRHAHHRGIVHLDLKPANVRITPGGDAKLMNIGLFEAMRRGVAGYDSQRGSPAYLSPEQAAGLPGTRKSDVWSLGVVLWEMLCGRRLFAGPTIAHTLRAAASAEIDFNRLNTLASPPLEKLLRRCLIRDPKLRPNMTGAMEILDKTFPPVRVVTRIGLGTGRGFLLRRLTAFSA